MYCVPRASRNGICRSEENRATPGCSMSFLLCEKMTSSAVGVQGNGMNGELGDRAGTLADQAAQANVRQVLAIAAGDREAEREFAERYLPRVRAMLLARSRDVDLTADLQQEVMIEAICALRKGQLRESSKLTPFVLAIARNVLNSHYRGAARQPEPLEFPDDLPDLSSATAQLEDKQREAL